MYQNKISAPTKPFKTLDLFSGVGGFSLGLERAGFETVAFCEIDKKAQLVLKKHWPDVPIFDDVTKLTGNILHDRGIAVDVICGGFPCQDISVAGHGTGLEGKRSGLWSEFARLISEIRPQYAIVENVSALLNRGLDRILGDLASLGYDAEWHCIPASAVGAPHRRDRVWIVGYSNSLRELQPQRRKQKERGWPRNASSALADANGERLASMRGECSDFTEKSAFRRDIGARSGLDAKREKSVCGAWENKISFTNAFSERLERQREKAFRAKEENKNSSDTCWWAVEPDVDRVAYGLPNRVDRIKQLGNAVVPQIPEIIGLAIQDFENLKGLNESRGDE